MDEFEKQLELRKQIRKQNSFCCGCRLGFLLDISFLSFLFFILYIVLDPELVFFRVKLYEWFNIKT